ncbi:PEP-CTERM sorting domain-containing protein [Dasania marina]|uniref:PEP-CTERM sorting domain-containing protein n=1 Tax=Dasania marina TaxID=471499 RepID=UPI0030D7A18E
MNKLLGGVISTVIMSTSLSASAGVINNWEGTGVDFFSSWIGDTLRIEIDAGNITAGSGWDGAVRIDSIAINDFGVAFANASDVTLDGPGASFDGIADGWGLNANGCQALTGGVNHPCFSGSELLTNNMFFDFTFANAVSNYTDNPHLKVRFIDANGNKKGSLLSQDLPSRTVVPEPSSIALLFLGLAGLLASRRQQH